MIVIGSRGSALALWQARHIAAKLKELGEESRIEIIKTTGDRMQEMSLAAAGGVAAGGKGLFTKEIEEALLGRQIDLAVHSMKDLPTEIPHGLTIAAIPERENPQDALVGRSLGELNRGAKDRNELPAPGLAVARSRPQAGDRGGAGQRRYPAAEARRRAV